MKEIIFYQCDICKKRYEKQEDCFECEAQGMEKPKAKVGDIVTIWRDYGWFDGDKRWVKNFTDRNFDKRELHFYYVITKIEKDKEEPHRLRYHLFTNAMTGKEGHHSGYTYLKTHYSFRKVNNPPAFVLEDSKKLLNKKAKYLM